MPTFQPPQPLPGGATLAAEQARELATLKGPGYQPTPGSLDEADDEALGQGLAGAHDRQTACAEEALPDRATALLGDWEARLGLVTSPLAAAADRRAALRAKRRATGGGTRARMTAAVQAIDPAGTVVTNDAAAVTDPRDVYQFAVTISAAVWSDAAKREAVRVVVDQMKQAPTRFCVAVKAAFKCDDPDSLCDRDALEV